MLLKMERNIFMFYRSIWEKKKITAGLYKVTSITSQFNIFHSFEEFQDVCVITWKFLTGIFQLWKNYEISTQVSFSLQYQTK